MQAKVLSFLVKYLFMSVMVAIVLRREGTLSHH